MQSYRGFLVVGWMAAVGAAMAQSPSSQFACITTAAQVPILRAEGIAELAGDVILSCSSGLQPTPSGKPVPTVDITLFFNGTLSGRLYPNGWSDPLLLIDEPGSGLVGTTNTQLACSDPTGICPITGTGVGVFDGSPGRPNIFPGRIGKNYVTFYGIPIDAPPALSGRIFRFTNIRVDPTSLAHNMANEIPVITLVSVSGYVSLLITNPEPRIATVQNGLDFSVRTPDASGPAGSNTVTQCAGPQRAAVLRFAEKFPASFKKRSAARFIDSETSPAVVAQNVPGKTYNTESGFYNPVLTAPTVDFTTAGLADSGTRLRASMSNIPPGAQVFVSSTNVTFAGNVPASAGAGSVARLVGSDAAPFSPAPVTDTLEGVAAVQLPVIDGTAIAEWEVLDADPTAAENFDFAVWVRGGASPGAASVTGSFAPIPLPPSPGKPVLPIPRFVASENTLSLFSSGTCPQPTATVLSTGVQAAAPKSSVVLTATVTGSNGVPAGTVTFFDAGVAIPGGTATLKGDGTASYSAIFDSGTHHLTAAFNPSNRSYLASTSMPAVLFVGAVVSNLTLTSSLSPAMLGQQVTFTAKAGSDVNRSGTVQFLDGVQSLGTAGINNGQATFTTSFLSAGTHSIYAVAVYDGDSSAADVSPRFGQVVNKLTPSLALNASATSSVFGQNVVFNVTLDAPRGPGIAPGSGAVQLMDGGSVVAMATLMFGAASLNVTTIDAGKHEIVAVYAGDTNWSSVRSGSVSLDVAPLTTTTTLNVISTPDRTILTAVVKTVSGIVPSGEISIFDSTTKSALLATRLVNDAAGITLSAVDAAALKGDRLMATYGGSASLVQSTSSVVILPPMRNAAGGPSAHFVPDEIVGIFGTNLGLGGVGIRDNALTHWGTATGFVGPDEVSFVVPAGTAQGTADITFGAYEVVVDIAWVAPGIFTSDGSAAKAHVARVRADGTTSLESVASGIDLRADTVYLVLYGTGIRHRTDLRNVTCTINGQELPVDFAGAHPFLPGFDQVNVLLPLSLKGAGTVDVSISVDGVLANIVTVKFL